MAATLSPAPPSVKMRRIALAGNPNAGKTTLFNALTGLRNKVGNYPGVTVEKKEGRARLDGAEVQILDLPGTYSLAPKSPDEEIARDVLLGLRADTPPPDVVVVVVDASNLERNLVLATQILELGLPTIIALNMIDVARANGLNVDVARLQSELGAPVVPIVAVRGEGLDALKRILESEIALPNPPIVELDDALENARTELAQIIGRDDASDQISQSAGARGIALRLLCGNAPIEGVSRVFGSEVAQKLEDLRENAAFKTQNETNARFRAIGAIVRHVLVKEKRAVSRTFTDRADAVLTHPFWGLVVFGAILLLVFQALYSFAEWPMSAIENLQVWGQNFFSERLPEGPLRDLLIDGVIAGVGAVVVFLPQILILFFFIGLLEDSGYMARAAFIMDKTMSRVGLPGRAFIPLLSSFACAIPGVMATRTIASRRDRITTILIAPLMACSARLPVYTLMIGTFIPETRVFGFVSSRALTMFGLYAFGTILALGVAWLLKRSVLKGPTTSLMIELPLYKRPVLKNVLIEMWQRSFAFLQRAGTVIFALSIILWFLLNYPKPSQSALDALPNDEAKSALIARNSIAGRVGKAIEPAIAPLGFNWKVGVGLIGAMAAREVFVSTMGTVYSVGEADEESKPLRQAMREDKWPDGRPVWTTLTAVSLMVYFVIAMQCFSTLAVVRRETNGWGWPLFMLVYMTVLAWICSFLVFQGGRFLGF